MLKAVRRLGRHGHPANRVFERLRRRSISASVQLVMRVLGRRFRVRVCVQFKGAHSLTPDIGTSRR